MIKNIDERASLIMDAVDGLSSFEAIGVLTVVIGHIASPTNDQI